jgi:hypothetical protein
MLASRALLLDGGTRVRVVAASRVVPGWNS